MSRQFRDQWCSLTRLFTIVLVLFAQGVTAADRPSDHRITQTVERELQNDFRLREAEIEVRTTAGKVTLTGKVDSVLDKRRAERLCRKIDGIQEVSNRIEIEPVPRSDEDISH
ncbi:MAG TPA: BON domain-containing protein, partial [Planctomycetaceae bacterium]|nr:BON domain-containing protein [Planctomycetaceae bacterium]